MKPTWLLLFLMLSMLQCSPRQQLSDAPSVTKIPPPVNPAQDSSRQSIFEYFDRGGIPEITLMTDLDYLIRNKDSTDFIEGLMSEQLTGTPQEWPLRIRARGKTRRKICEFPPLKIKFRKSPLRESELNDHNDFKLVTHCYEEKLSQQYLLREYMAYRIYNLLSPASFKALLVRVKYVDASKRNPPVTRLALLLEDEDMLADRMNGEFKEVFGLTGKNLKDDQMALLSLFQYLIGNTDWGVRNQHNIGILYPAGGGKPMIVPYDFDFSGLVNSPSALPNPNCGQKSVTQRIYLGKTTPYSQVKKQLPFIISKKEAILGLIESTPELDENSRVHLRSFLGAFFDQLEQPRQFRETLTANGDRFCVYLDK